MVREEREEEAWRSVHLTSILASFDPSQLLFTPPHPHLKVTLIPHLPSPLIHTRWHLVAWYRCRLASGTLWGSSGRSQVAAPGVHRVMLRCHGLALSSSHGTEAST